MTDIQALESRLAQLEVTVADMRRELAEAKKPAKCWVESITGSFADCPEFDEVLRLGKEYRDSQRMECDDEENA